MRHSLTCSPAFKLVPSLSFLRSSSSAPPEIDRDLLAPTHSARLARAFTPIDVATKLKTFSAFILQKKRGESLELFHFSPDCLLYILYPTLSTSNYTTDILNIENIKNIGPQNMHPVKETFLTHFSPPICRYMFEAT